MILKINDKIVDVLKENPKYEWNLIEMKKPQLELEQCKAEVSDYLQSPVDFIINQVPFCMKEDQSLEALAREIYIDYYNGTQDSLVNDFMYRASVWGYGELVETLSKLEAQNIITLLG